MTKKEIVLHLRAGHHWAMAGVGYDRITKAEYAAWHEALHGEKRDPLATALAEIVAGDETADHEHAETVTS